MKNHSSLRSLSTVGVVFACFAGVLGLSACTEKKELPPPAQQEKEKQAEASREAESVKKSEDQPEPLSLGHQFPVGPRLVFLPGKGVGAIRFGATVETIERHMEAPCDKKTEDRCLYVREAVEFFLKDGVLERIKAHRRDREISDPPENGEKYFGSLRGIVQPKIMLGLHRHIVLEEFGEPKKKEPVSPPGPGGLVDRHYYDGINFEYDKIKNGNTVLAAIEIYPSQTPYAPPKMAGELVPPPRAPAQKGPLPNEQRAK